LDLKKIDKSSADYWVLPIVSMQRHTTMAFVIIKPSALAKRYRAIHGSASRVNTYLWVTSTDPQQCWETRSLKKADKDKVASGTYRHSARNFSRSLGNWSPIAALD